MEKTYSGKITNNGTQMTPALTQTPKQNNPKVQKGGDLRAKPSQKK